MNHGSEYCHEILQEDGLWRRLEPSIAFREKVSIWKFAAEHWLKIPLCPEWGRIMCNGWNLCFICILIVRGTARMSIVEWAFFFQPISPCSSSCVESLCPSCSVLHGWSYSPTSRWATQRRARGLTPHKIFEWQPPPRSLRLAFWSCVTWCDFL